MPESPRPLSRKALQEAVQRSGLSQVHQMVEQAKEQLADPTVVLVPYFVEFDTQASVGELALDYCAWVLGVNDDADKRKARLDVGLPEEWTIHRIIGAEGDGVFHGQGRNHMMLETRVVMGREKDTEPARFVLDWMHLSYQKLAGKPRMSVRSEKNGHVPCAWKTVVDIARVPGRPGISRVRHAVATRHVDGLVSPWRGGCPTILQRLLREERAQEPHFPSHPWHVAMRDSAAYITSDLLNPDRLIPHLVLTSPRGTAAPLVDPERLQKALFGLVHVVVLEPDKGECWNLFTETLERHGFSKEFSCYDGGVRLYLPAFETGMNREQMFEHRLWTKHHLQDPEKGFTQVVKTASWLVSRWRMPAGFIRLVNDFDRASSLDRARAVLEAPQTGRPSEDQTRALTAALSDTQGQLALAMEENERLTADHRTLEARVEGLEALNADLQDRFQRVLGARQRTTFDAEDEAAQIRFQEAADACLGGSPTLEQSLVFLAETYPNRLVILDTAWESAREAEAFRHRKEAFTLLRTFATDYRKALAEGGGGDAQARQCFAPQYYASKDKTNLPKKGRRLRTFEYLGEQIFFERHLKIGVADSITETWRCHFHWDAERKRLVIGWCGRHLDFD